MKNGKDYLNELKKSRLVSRVHMLIKQNKIQKSQIALLLLSVGAIVFLSIPNGKKMYTANQTTGLQNKKTSRKSDATKMGDDWYKNYSSDYISDMERELEEMLSNVKGVGTVKVMITLEDAGQQIVDKDVNEEKNNDAVSEQTQRQEQTVVLEDESGNQNALITQQLQPEIKGVVVICEGGDNPQVIADVSYAVEVLFSLSAHKVKVMKMVS